MQAELARIVLNPERIPQLPPDVARVAAGLFSILATRCTIRVNLMGPGKPTRGPRARKSQG